MFQIIKQIVDSVQPKHDDDYIDRMNNAFTAFIYFGIILIIGCKQYLGEGIQCVVPAESTRWEPKIESFCYHGKMFYANATSTYMPEKTDINYDKLSYYKWVPYYALLPLLLLFFPRHFWSSFSRDTGYSVRSLFGKMQSNEREALTMETKVDGSNKLITSASESLISKLENRYSQKLQKRFALPTFTMAYMCFKMCNLIIGILQFVMVNFFFRTPFNEFYYILIRKFRGPLGRILQNPIVFESWEEENAHFPRTAYCDYMRRDDVSSLPMNFVVQCYLGANIFHEYMYMGICVWAIFLTCLNCINIVYWMSTVFSSSYAKKFVLTQLPYAGAYISEDVDIFVKEYLSTDIITALRLVSLNLGNEISSNVISLIYKNYKQNEDNDPIISISDD